MKKKITPIAMKCNKEQFEAIKPKLEGIEIYSVTCFNDYPYLTNTGGYLDSISNISKGNFEVTLSRVECIYEIWNERIFLEACGFETEETFEITKETIIKYKMKDEFPEVFEVKLENNTWYVCHHYSSRHLVNLNITDKLNTHNKGFGFDSHGKWTNDLTFLKTFDYKFELATKQEVFEALKNEAVKRGFKEGVCVQDVYNGKTEKCTTSISSNNFDYEKIGAGINSGKMALRDSDGSIIFFNGKWAKIIPTKTKEEAEKLLNCKIID